MKTSKKALALALVLWCFEDIALSQFLTNGLVAYYPFKGNSNDESGNGLNGTVSNAFLVPDRYGIPNSAYGFNGRNCAILFASTPLTNVDNWTLWVWMAPAALPQAGVALTVGVDNGGAPSSGYWLSVQSIGNGPGSGLIGGFPQVGPIDKWVRLPDGWPLVSRRDAPGFGRNEVLRERQPNPRDRCA